MKLISCYIENFGNLRKKTINFDENITTFYEENGFGKTTLAAFIKAMFYGLEAYTKATKAFVDREHYYPFNEQAFGGNITFSHNNKIYRVERFFGEKTDKYDTFTLYCNDTISRDYSKEIGKELFGIDKESFERVLFINDEDIEISSTSSINLKLNNILSDTKDIDLDEALKELDNKSKLYKSNKSEKSLVHKGIEKIKQLSVDIQNKYNTKISLDAKYIKLQNINSQVEVLKEKELLAKKSDLYKKAKENYELTSKKLLEKQSEIEALNKKFPYGLPTNNELTNINEEFKNLKVLNEKLTNQILTPSEEYELSQYKIKFENHPLNENEVYEIKQDIEEINKLNQQINNLGENQYSENEKELLNKLEGYRISDEKINILNKNMDEYRNLKRLNVPNSTLDNKNFKHKKLFVALFIICAILILSGIPICFKNLVVGLMIVAIALIGLIITGIIYLDKKHSNNVSKPESVVQIQRVENNIRAFFLAYDYMIDKDVEYLYDKFMDDLKTYETLKVRREQNDLLLKELEAQRQSIQEKLEKYFNVYNIEKQNYYDCIIELERQNKAYLTFKEKLSNDQKSKEETHAKINKLHSKIKEFCDKYGLNILTIENEISNIFKDINAYETLNKAINEIKVDLEKIEKDPDFNVNVDELDVSLDEVKAELDEANKALTFLKNEIDSDEYAIEILEELENQLIQEQERVEEYKAKYDIFQNTIGALKQAEQNLKDKYIGPIKDKFLKYTNIMEKAIGDKIAMDKNYKISFERNGKYRKEHHLSSGNKSVCALCFRLALIENMYKDEKPFIIMDDPFVSLDENHIQKAIDVIKELSKDIQIVYFTCHNSRNIK